MPQSLSKVLVHLIFRTKHRESLISRVAPLQGEESLFGPSSRGVAPGFRVLAPLARQTGAMGWGDRKKDIHLDKVDRLLGEHGIQKGSAADRARFEHRA